MPKSKLFKSKLFKSNISKAKTVLNYKKQKLKFFILRRVVDRLYHADFAGVTWFWCRDKDNKIFNLRCCCPICGLRLNSVHNESCKICGNKLEEPEFVTKFFEDSSPVKVFIEAELSLMRAGKKRIRTSFQKEFLYQKYNQPPLLEERTGSMPSTLAIFLKSKNKKLR